MKWNHFIYRVIHEPFRDILVFIICWCDCYYVPWVSWFMSHMFNDWHSNSLSVHLKLAIQKSQYFKAKIVTSSHKKVWKTNFAYKMHFLYGGELFLKIQHFRSYWDYEFYIIRADLTDRRVLVVRRPKSCFNPSLCLLPVWPKLSWVSIPVLEKCWLNIKSLKKIPVGIWKYRKERFCYFTLLKTQW